MPELVSPHTDVAPLDDDEIALLLGNHRMFLSTVFDMDLWHMQRQIADALDAYDAVGVKACHSSGKTALAAGLGCSFLARHPDSIVISTAPTWTQVEKLLWGEVHTLVGRAKYIAFPVPLATELKVSDQHYFIGYSTNEAVRFQGWHAPNVLVIIDEAPGVAPDIYDAIAGIEAGGRVRKLLLGNPTIATGPFYEAFTKARRFWKLFTISAFDTPNLAGCYFDDGHAETRIAMRLPPPPGMAPVNLAEIEDENDPRLAYSPRPYLTTRKWVWKKCIEWGVLTATFQSRVLGKFPDTDPYALVGLGLMEDAEPALIADAGDALDFGLDVAGPGDDDTVLQTVLGDNLVKTRSWPHGECETQVIAAVREDERRYGRPLRHLGVDTAGVGHYFANTLVAAGLRVTRVNVANTAVGFEDGGNGRRVPCATIYDSLGAQRYYRLQRRFKERRLHNLASSEDTVAQVLSLRVDPSGKGKIAMESKRKRRSRGLSSPDYAEALMLAQYCPDLDRPTRPRGAVAPSMSYGG